MAAEHATLMVLKVDLECCSCFLKVKKVLAIFPQIGDQVYDWKQNEVTISVICCNPHEILHKLCSKAGKAIKSIKIKEPGKPKPKPLGFTTRPDLNTLDGLTRLRARAKPKDTEKPKTAEKPKHTQQPKDMKKPKEIAKKVSFVDNSRSEKPNKSTKPTKADPSKTLESAAKPEPVKIPDPANGYPLQVYLPVDPAAAYYDGQCSDVYGGGPWHHGYVCPFHHHMGRWCTGMVSIRLLTLIALIILVKIHQDARLWINILHATRIPLEQHLLFLLENIYLN